MTARRSPFAWRALPALAAFLLIPIVIPPLSGQAEPPGLQEAVADLEWREIGPTIMGGRVADLAVVESDPSTFYVGTASGGVWKTVNGGTSFEPVFDDQETASIGDVILAPSNPNVVWVGTGEPQNRQSSPWGGGVYRSLDGGKSWSHLGLEATHHIARIQVHPLDPDIAYVAAVGHLWGPNPERGVYKTTDGGETWERVLFVDEDTGAIDLVMDPGDPRTLFAATYQRRRTAWGFNGGGPGGGIWRTLDGGETWERLTEGLPEGDLGRIGLAAFRGDGDLVFALVEADPRRPGQGFGGGEGRGERKNGVYRSTDRGETWEHLSTTNNRPMYYSQIWIDPNDPERVYLGGSRLYMSEDGGREFTDEAAADVHLDHHALWIDPNDSDHLIVAGDGGVSVSWDRSKTWRQLRNLPIAQFYEIGVDRRDPYHVCGGLQDNGSWCTPSDTRSEQGIRPRHWYNVGRGDGFFTVHHPSDTTLMLAESQGGNLTRVDLVIGERKWIRPDDRHLEGLEEAESVEEGQAEEPVEREAASEEGEEEDEEPELRWNWNTPVVLSTHDPSTLYIGANVLLRSRDLGESWERISPDLTWAIDRDTLTIMGVKGSEPMMSRNDGISSYGNLTAIAESPLDPELLYAGSDDGRVHVTRDGGGSWTDITANFPGLPERTYVTRLVASGADAAAAYAAFDGHRNDDFRPYVYVTRDHGATWRPIVDGLPETPVNALAEHPGTPSLVFAGNEVGVYFSVDGGGSWAPLRGNLPTVPVDDLLVHPSQNDLVIGTHGRGIWILDDIAPLERLGAEVLASDVHLFPSRQATYLNEYDPQEWTPGIWQAENPPRGAVIRYYLREPVPEEAAADDEPAASEETATEGGAGAARAPSPERAARAPASPPRRTGNGDSSAVRVTILDAEGETVRELEGPNEAGIQQVTWDLRIEPPYEPERDGGGGGFFGAPRGPRVLPGEYTVRLEAGDGSWETPLGVRLDPRVEIAREDFVARQEALMSAYRLAKPVYEANRALDRVGTQLEDVEKLLDEQESPPEAVVEEVEALGEEIEELEEELREASAGSFIAFTLDGSISRPTADQLWRLDKSWEEVPPVIERINRVIEERVPALYRQLDEHGVRPDPGEPVEVPTRPEG